MAEARIGWTCNLTPGKGIPEMPHLLNLIYLIALAIYSPVLLWKNWRLGKYRQGWASKFWGKVPRRIGDRPCFWFHAVSVGEVRLLRPLVEGLARRHPDWDLVISTTTPTGLSVARREFPDLVTFYAPLDFSWAVGRALARIRPTVLALVELELWPNLIRAADRSGTRVAVVNARLGERSHRGYGRVRLLLRPLFRRIGLVAAQTGEYGDRFQDLGVEADRVVVTGSVKYDGLESDRENRGTIQLRHDLEIRPSDLVFVAGSTMDGEELAAFEAYRSARGSHPTLRLVVVPRHPERFDSVAELLASRGVPVVRRSGRAAPFPKNPRHPDEPAVHLIDTLGELSAVYGLADVAFVGGSLFPGRGGQNLMEPAAYGASVLFGPHTENFKAAAEGLLSRSAARRVRDSRDLADAVLQDLDDPESANARGQAARRFVLAQAGASDRTIQALEQLVDPRMTAGETSRRRHHPQLAGACF